MNVICILLSLAANLDWPMQHFDVKNAFLHGDLEEQVYMDTPPGFYEGFINNSVCNRRFQ